MEYYELINSDYLECCQKSHICYKVKVELLDHYENTLGELTTSISNTSGSINISYSQGVRRNCNISVFNYNHKFDLDKHDSDFFINRKFKVYTGIQAYSDTYWFSQGIFIAQSCSSDNNVISISGVDKFGLFTDALNSNKLQTAHSIPCDQKIGNIIKDTICRDMGNGVPTDPILPNIDSSLYDIELPYDIEKTANEYLGDILIEIATALHADIYYDTQGRLVLQPNIVDEYTMQSLIYEFEENGQEFIEQSYSSDYGNVINIITVTGSNTDDIVCSYTAKNENPQSPLNINNIGAKHGEIEETAMGYSEKRCKDYAEYLLKKQLMLTVSKSISCTPLPHLDVNKVVRINNKKENCHNLKAVTFGDNCTFNNGFSYTCTQCRNLQEITFGDNCNIGSFYNPGTSNLRKVVFGMNCSIGNINLTYYNANLEEFITDETTTISGDCMFNAAYYLRSVGALNFVDLPNTTYNINFNQCYSLQSVEVTNTSILAGENSEAEYTLDFYQCYNLKSFIIPDGVKALKNYVFKDCISLSSITIPYSVTSIGNGAFENCKDLESITILNPTCGIYDSQYTISNTATIYGHASSTAQSYANKYNRTFVEITE